MTWVIEEGEEARLTPGESAAARIVSRGLLPFRVRTKTESSAHVSFPGTAVVLGDQVFEVLEEHVTATGVVYDLGRWREEDIYRGQVVYDSELIRSVKEHRLFLERREKARPYAWALAPVVGLLPEEEQTLKAEALGLDPVGTTMAAAITEILLVLVVLWVATISTEGVAQIVVRVAAVFLGLGVVFPAVARYLSAVLLGEIAGSTIVELAYRLRVVAESGARLFDPSLAPLSRRMFWARLHLPDRHEESGDGSLVVTSPLAHLSWEAIGRLSVKGDWWSVMPLEPWLQHGRIVFCYRLIPLIDPGSDMKLEPPAPDVYQRDLRGELERRWDRLTMILGGSVVSLLPAEVQEQALRHRGGVRVLRPASLVTALSTLGLGMMVIASQVAAVVPVGLVLVADGAVRFWHLSHRRAAPSFLGGLLSPCISPDVEIYRAHRDAELSAFEKLVA